MWQNNYSVIRAGNDDGLLVQCHGNVRSKAFSQTGTSLQSWVAIFFLPGKASFTGEGYRWKISGSSRGYGCRPALSVQ